MIGMTLGLKFTGTPLTGPIVVSAIPEKEFEVDQDLIKTDENTGSDRDNPELLQKSKNGKGSSGRRADKAERKSQISKDDKESVQQKKPVSNFLIDLT